MNELDTARKSIDKIDTEMARLFEERMKTGREIAEYKKNHGLSVKDPAREAAVIEKNRRLITDSDIESYYVRFLEETMALSRDYQSRLMNGMRVSYCGTEGAFAHIAAKRMFTGAELISYPDFTSAYQAVERGEVDCAVLPLENSCEGEIGTVMDLIFQGSLYINQVLDLPVEHHLLGIPGTSIDSIKTVVSHPQALGQCADYIHKHGYESVSSANTAIAARQVMENGDNTVAAIASIETVELYGMEILDRDINDTRNNTTRFAAFSRSENRPSAKVKREDESFILVFTVQNEAGALAQTLNIIGAHGYNMRSVRSRPMKNLQWNYYFYIEAEGNINNENGSDMLHELSAVCAKLKLAGTYYANNL